MLGLFTRFRLADRVVVGIAQIDGPRPVEVQ